MPHCQNCGEFVTESYVRVFSRTSREGVEVCPWCEDMKRGTGGRPEEARSTRRGGNR